MEDAMTRLDDDYSEEVDWSMLAQHNNFNIWIYGKGYKNIWKGC